MKLYRHWVAETREIAGTTFHLRDGSNVSPEDAAAKLERRAAILRASEGRDLSEEESAAVREAILDLGGRTPEGEYEAAICEEVLEEPAPRSAVTRNRYGAEVLNSEDTCFVDVDAVRRPGPGIGLRIAARLCPFLACLAATIVLMRLSEGGRLDAGIGAVLMLAAVFATLVVAAVSLVKAFSADSILQAELEPKDRAEATLLAKVRALAEAPAWRGLAARVYRTAAGFRVLAQADGLAPGNRRFRALARALDADILYVDLCKKQGCWRARLTPKPERVGRKRPPRETRFPRPPEAEPAFAAWVSDYAAASDAYAVCRPLATVGRFVETPAVRLHDDRTRCASSFPLA